MNIKQGKLKHCNNFGILAGLTLLNEFHTCRMKDKKVDPRYYHEGIKGILDDKKQDTEFVNGILTKAEGLSPRWMLLR